MRRLLAALRDYLAAGYRVARGTVTDPATKVAIS